MTAYSLSDAITHEIQSFMLGASSVDWIEVPSAIEFIVDNMDEILMHMLTHEAVVEQILDDGVNEASVHSGEAYWVYQSFRSQLISISKLVEQEIKELSRYGQHNANIYVTFGGLSKTGRLGVCIDNHRG